MREPTAFGAGYRATLHCGDGVHPTVSQVVTIQGRRLPDMWVWLRLGNSRGERKRKGSYHSHREAAND